MSLKEVRTKSYVDSSYSHNFLSNIKSLRGQFTDVTLVSADAHEIASSRMVLAAASPYFKTRFRNQSSSRVQIENENISGGMLKVLVDFCHSGEADITTHNVEEILESSDYCDISSLSNGCVQFIVDHLEVGNCLNCLFLSYKLSLQHMQSTVISYIGEKFSSIERDALMDVPFPLMVGILKSPDILVTNKDANLLLSAVERELQLFQIVCAYITRNKPDGSTTKQLLLSLKIPLLFPNAACKQSLRSMLREDGTFQKLLDDCSRIKEDKSLMKQIRAIKDCPEGWHGLRKFSVITMDSYSFANEGQVNDVVDTFEKYFRLDAVYVNGLVVWIRLWDGRKVLGGLEVHWSNGEVATFGGTDGAERHEFHLDTGEHITGVQVRSGWLVDQLTFMTSRGKQYGPYGGSGGNVYSSYVHGKDYTSLSGFSGSVVDTQESLAITKLSLWYRCCDTAVYLGGGVLDELTLQGLQCPDIREYHATYGRVYS